MREKRKGAEMGMVSLKRILSAARAKATGVTEHIRSVSQAACARMCAKLSDERGQGTTEYAILVGVLVVIAIIAITVFRPKLEELWNAIADGMNSL